MLKKSSQITYRKKQHSSVQILQLQIMDPKEKRRARNPKIA
jgi:hypothetical protein